MTAITKTILTRAVAEAWMNPQVDRQITFIPSRMTGLDGALGFVNAPWRNIQLPDQTNFYVVYEVGQLAVTTFGIESKIMDWTSINDLLLTDDLFPTLYINSRMLFLANSFITRSTDRNTLIAIRRTDNASLLDTGLAMHARFYRNAWFTTVDGRASTGLSNKSVQVTSTSEATTFTNAYTLAANAVNSNVHCFINGVYSDEFIASELPIGTNAFYYRDYSGLGYFDITISDLPNFESILDARKKYLIQQPDNGRTVVDFFDDLEIYICAEVDNGFGETSIKGVYYPFLNHSDIRQVTHRDWSIDVLRCQAIIIEQGVDMSFHNPFLRVFIRNGQGMRQPIADGNNNYDLYLLDVSQRTALMLGTASTYTPWQAANLENSPYAKWMNLDSMLLTEERLGGVYSYDGVLRLTAKPVIDNGVAILPANMHGGGAVFEYDSVGHLVKVAVVLPSVTYTLTSSSGSISLVPGSIASTPLDLDTVSLFDSDFVGAYSEELLYCDNSGVWKIAIEDIDFVYDPIAQVVNWKEIHFSHLLRKRLGGVFYTREVTIAPAQITDSINIFEDGRLPVSPLSIGRVDIWINGKKGIRGLDYIDEYPNFRVTGRAHYNAGGIHIRILLSGTSEDKTPSRFGYITHRLISYNGHYDIAFNREVDITIGGMRALREEVNFSETRGTGIMDERFTEGLPYSIEYPVNSLSRVTMDKLGVSKRSAYSDDREIENLLSLRVPESPVTGNILIPGKYRVVSTLLHQLLEAIIIGDIKPDSAAMSDEYAATLASPYLYLLASDVYSHPDSDWDFLELYPTGRDSTVSVTAAGFSFLQKINKLYLGNRANLNLFLTVT